MKAVYTLTPSEGRRLIAKGIVQMPEVRAAWEKAYIVLVGSTINGFVAQELLAYHGPELYYWAREARGSSAEVDFLVVCGGEIFPLEVKSGAGGSLKSLHLMLGKYTNCPKGLVFYSGVYKNLPEQKLEFLPVYSVASICDKRRDDLRR